MIPTAEEIERASKIENKEVREAIKDYQEYKDKFWVHKEKPIEKDRHGE